MPREKLFGVRVQYNGGCEEYDCFSAGSATIILPEKPTVADRIAARILHARLSRDTAYDLAEIVRRSTNQKP